MTKIKKFGPIHRRAKKRKGDELDDWLVDPANPTKLRRTKDDRFPSAMTACVFRAGFRWKVIQAKWPGFEEAFHGFAVPRNAAMDDGIISDLMTDTRVVRNRMKIETVRENAAFILRVNEEHKSFGLFVASWPEDDLVGLAFNQWHGETGLPYCHLSRIAACSVP